MWYVRMRFVTGMLLVLLFVIMGLPAGHVQAGTAYGGGPPSGTSGWQLVFNDNFDGTSLDTTAWTACNDSTCNSYFGLGTWSSSNVVVSNGQLELHAKKNGSTDCVSPSTCTTSIITGKNKFSFTYGYMEAKMKLAKGNGLWPAFWAMPVPQTGLCNWPPEIDVLEQNGINPTVAHFNYIYPGTSCSKLDSPGSYTNADDLGNAWHYYGAKWDSSSITWYVDGVQRYTTSQSDANRAFYLLLDNAFGTGSWENNKPDSTTPSDSALLVDYVRVWQANSDNQNLASNPGFESGAMSPWTTWGTGGGIDTTNPHSGTYAVKLNASAGGVEQVVSGLSSNTTYTVRGWGKVATVGDTVKIGVKDYGGSELNQSITSTSYTPASVTFTTGSTNTSARIFIYHVSPGATGNAYGDDFELLVNPVANPGFETGALSPWTTWGTGGSADTTNPHSGTYAVKLNTSDGGAEQLISLNAGTTYTLRGWGKVGTVGDNVKIGVKNYGGADLSQTISSLTYSQATVTFTTGVTNSSAKIFIYHNGTTAAGNAYGDDFELTANLADNPGFETGSLSPWTTWGTGGSTDTSNARSGTYAVKLNASDGGAEQVVYGLKPGTTYTVRGWGKVATVGDNVKIGVKNYGGADLSQTISSLTYSQVSVTFTTGASDINAKIFIYHNGTTATGNAYGDDFELIEGF